MPKQQITIEVDIPDGYEATGEFRSPKVGDYWIGQDLRLVGPSTTDFLRHPARIILRKKWQWPESVTANWIATDDNGYWVKLFDDEPQQDASVWWCKSGRISRLDASHVTWTPPAAGTKHKNPNAK